MKLWKGNLKTGEWELPIEEIAQFYMQSHWPDELMPVEPKVAQFLSDPDGPINSSWEDRDEFFRLADLVIDLEQQRRDEQRKVQP